MAALVIMTLMFSAAFVAARAQEATVKRIQMSAPAIKRWGGALLIGVGVWFVALATFANFFADLYPV
ncbi:MAG: hypothetical protein WD602_01800 [Actinomycetota bacterium]